MNTIKWELEDLSFATLYPKVYDEIVRMVAERAPAREEYLATVLEQVDADLRDAKIKATVTGRPKHYCSIYQKMIMRGRDFERHLRPGRRARPGRLGARLLRGARRDARALEAGPGPVQGLHRDAQVQHVPVAAHHGDRARGKPVEVQIRTHEMHRRAEYGVAAHWKYKESAEERAPPERRRAATTWGGCGSSSTGSGRPRTRASSWTRCGSRSPAPRSSSSRPRAT